MHVLKFAAIRTPPLTLAQLVMQVNIWFVYRVIVF